MCDKKDYDVLPTKAYLTTAIEFKNQNKQERPLIFQDSIKNKIAFLFF